MPFARCWLDPVVRCTILRITVDSWGSRDTEEKIPVNWSSCSVVIVVVKPCEGKVSFPRVNDQHKVDGAYNKAREEENETVVCMAIGGV